MQSLVGLASSNDGHVTSYNKIPLRPNSVYCNYYCAIAQLYYYFN